jgi:nitrogen fixation protein FixH
MQTSAARRRPGWWYPYIYLGVFLVVLAVNLVFMTSAVRTFSGLETEHAYDKGLAYNEVLAKARAQDHLGWTVEAQLMPRDDGALDSHNADVLVTFIDKAGKPVTGLSVVAELVRPTKTGYDQTIDLAEQGEGRYVAMAKLPLAGQWEMHVKAHKAETDYQLTQRVLVP